MNRGGIDYGDQVGLSRGKSHSNSTLAMITGWMLAMAFGAAGFIWFGIASWHDPGTSILSIGFGIFLILMSVARIVRKELESGGKQGK